MEDHLEDLVVKYLFYLCMYSDAGIKTPYINLPEKSQVYNFDCTARKGTRHISMTPYYMEIRRAKISGRIVEYANVYELLM